MHTRRDSRLSASGSKTKNAGPADGKPSDARSRFNGELPSYWTTKRLRTRQVWQPKESRRQSSAGESMTASGNHLNVTGHDADVRPCNFETKRTFCAEPVGKRDPTASTASLPVFDEAWEEVPLVDAQVGDHQIPKPGTSFTKVQSPLNIQYFSTALNVQNVSSDGSAAVDTNIDQISLPLNRFARSSSFEDSSAGEDWDQIVEELQEMGYHKSE